MKLRRKLGAAARILILASAGNALHGWPPFCASVRAQGILAPGSSISASPLGTNTDFFRYHSSEWVFVDAFKQSRRWLTQCTPNTGQADCSYSNSFDTHEEAMLDLDPDGWVRSLPKPEDAPVYWIAGTTLFNIPGGHFPAGQYIVFYDGSGTMIYSGSAAKNNALSTPGRDVLDVTPSSAGISVQITATTPGNYIRNIRMIMPGYESSYATQIFHPAFLAKIVGYRALRFLDWLETNSSTQSSWSTRTTLSSARWDTPGGAGLPVEIMADLANRNQSNAWVNMPHQADDEYITQFAALVKNRLNPGLKVYVEYSNEVWNGAPGFDQSAWVQQQAIAKWTGSESAYTKQINWHGMRTAQMCDIWKQVWGSQSNRVICVMGAQSANPWTASQALDCPLWAEGKPCTTHGIDAVAIGPYFAGYLGNATFQPQVLAWTSSEPDGGLDKLFQEINQGGAVTGGPSGGALKAVRDQVSAHIGIANARGLSVVAYEGGSHLHDNLNNAAVINLFQAANHDSRMGQAYDQYLADWKAQGGRLFVHFKNVSVPNSYGAFGALDYLDDTGSPKYDALMRFINANPCWWDHCAYSAFGTYLPLIQR